VIGVVWDEAYFSKLQQVAGSAGVGAAFVWLGFIENAHIADYLQACDLTVQPYLNGANSNRTSIIATIALGVPAVTTYVAGVTPEDFCNEENVLLVSPNAPREIAAAVLRVYGDERLRRTLAEGMKRLAARFNWEVAATVTAQACRLALRGADS
jgi:glycosyltransferase involved in cell wall biosynthesis